MHNSILGVNKPQQKSKISYIDFELTNYDSKDLKKAFDLWKKDDSYLQSYDKYSFLPSGVDLLLVRVFRYEETSKNVLGVDGNPVTLTKVLPYCKVIKTSDHSTILPGTILLASDRLGDLYTNPDWLTWKDIKEKERPTLDIPEPSKTIGLINDWRNNSKFVLDKFNPTTEDDYTFIRPSSDFKMMIK